MITYKLVYVNISEYAVFSNSIYRDISNTQVDKFQNICTH